MFYAQETLTWNFPKAESEIMWAWPNCGSVFGRGSQVWLGQFSSGNAAVYVGWMARSAVLPPLFPQAVVVYTKVPHDASLMQHNEWQHGIHQFGNSARWSGSSVPNWFLCVTGVNSRSGRVAAKIDHTNAVTCNGSLLGTYLMICAKQNPI